MNVDSDGPVHVLWAWKTFPYNISGLLTWVYFVAFIIHDFLYRFLVDFYSN